MILDAHQHVWELDRADYAWLTPDAGPLHRDFVEDEVLPAQRACGVDGAVLVQAADDPRETAYLLEVAEAFPQIVGVVGFVPLELPSVAAEALDGLATHPWFAGVRSLVHDRPDPRWLERPEVDEGVGVLEGAGVPFDLVADRPEHLALLPGLGERHPELDVVIDHLAKPPIGADGPWGPPGYARWDRLMTAAAENPRVHAKVSGLYALGPDPAAWTVEAIRPYVDRALELFGPDRLMYGGDWPVSTTAGGYERTFRGIREALSGLGEVDRDAVFGGTAARFYGIELAAQDVSTTGEDVSA